MLNLIYRLRSNDEIEIEPKKVNLKLIDITNTLIDFKNINVFIVLDLNKMV